MRQMPLATEALLSSGGRLQVVLATVRHPHSAFYHIKCQPGRQWPPEVSYKRQIPLATGALASSHGRPPTFMVAQAMQRW